MTLEVQTGSGFIPRHQGTVLRTSARNEAVVNVGKQPLKGFGSVYCHRSYDTLPPDVA